MKRPSSLIHTVFGVVLLVLCHGFLSCHRSVQTDPNTLVVGLETAPLSLDPRLGVDAYSSKISGLIHAGLFRLNQRLEPIPHLVARYEFKPPLTYRFFLKEGVRFHNGQGLRAEDVKFTLESILDPKLGSPHRSALEKIAGLRVIGPQELEITLKEPFAPFLATLTLGIIPQGGPSEVGTGPYRLEEFRAGEKVVLRRFDDYFETHGRMEKILFRVVPDDNLRVLELKQGRLDVLINSVPLLLLDHLRQDPSLSVQSAEGINYSYLGLNLSDERLRSVAVRQAMAYALNIPEILQYRLSGMARPATGLLSPVHWAYEGDVTTYPYDPDRARRLLDEAGWKDPDGRGPLPRFKLLYKTSARKDRVGLARLLARYWKDIGIEVKVQSLEWGTLFSDIRNGNFQIFSLTWVGLTEPDIFFNVFHSGEIPPAGANRGRYVNENLDRLVVEGRRNMDATQRRWVYSYVQKILSEELPYVSLWYEDNVAVYRRNVKDLRLRPDASFWPLVEVSK